VKYSTSVIDARAGSLTNVLRRSVYAVRELHGVIAIDAGARAAHYQFLDSPAVLPRREMLREHLVGLHRQWRAETGYSSSLAAKKAHPAYSEIVAMGEEAIAAILESIATQPDLLVMALHDITHQDPIAAEHRGRLSEMAGDWLRWGTEHGYRQ